MRMLEKRLQVLEAQHSGPEGFEVWIGDDDAMLGPNGEQLSRAEYAELHPDSIDIGGPLEGSSHEEF